MLLFVSRPAWCADFPVLSAFFPKPGFPLSWTHACEIWSSPGEDTNLHLTLVCFFLPLRRLVQTSLHWPPSGQGGLVSRCPNP